MTWTASITSSNRNDTPHQQPEISKLHIEQHQKCQNKKKRCSHCKRANLSRCTRRRI